MTKRETVILNSSDRNLNVGDIVLCTRIELSDLLSASVPAVAIPAKRLVNADGSRRQDLIAVRVDELRADSRRLSGDALRDGAAHTDVAVVELCEMPQAEDAPRFEIAEAHEPDLAFVAMATESDERVTEMVRVIQSALPIACASRDDLPAALRAEVETRLGVDLTGREAEALWPAMNRLDIDVTDGLAELRRDERPVHRGVIEESFAALIPLAIAASTGVSAVVASCAAYVSVKAASEERAAELDLERIQGQIEASQKSSSR